MRIRKEFISDILSTLFIIICFIINVVILGKLLYSPNKIFQCIGLAKLFTDIVFILYVITHSYSIEKAVKNIVEYIFEFDDKQNKVKDKSKNNASDSIKTLNKNHEQKQSCNTRLKPTKESELNGRIPEKGEIIFRDEEDTKPYSRIIIGDGITAPDKLPILKPLLQPLTNTNIQRRYNYIDTNGWWSQNQDSATTILQESKTVQNEILNKQCSMSNTENIDYEQVKKNMEQLVSDLGAPEAMLLFMMIGYGMGGSPYGTHQSLMNSNHWSIM